MDMKVKHAVVLGFMTLMISAVPAFGHHSFAAEFDETKPLTVNGVISKVEWQNPHVYFYVDAKDSKGNVVTWGFESSGTALMHHTGWQRDSLKVGDRVTVQGYAAKDGSHLLGARDTSKLVTLPDGRKVFGASAEDVSAKDQN
jgi:hypothetical protein